MFRSILIGIATLAVCLMPSVAFPQDHDDFASDLRSLGEEILQEHERFLDDDGSLDLGAVRMLDMVEQQVRNRPSEMHTEDFETWMELDLSHYLLAVTPVGDETSPLVERHLAKLNRLLEESWEYVASNQVRKENLQTWAAGLPEFGIYVYDQMWIFLQENELPLHLPEFQSSLERSAASLIEATGDDDADPKAEVELLSSMAVQLALRSAMDDALAEQQEMLSNIFRGPAYYRLMQTTPDFNPDEKVMERIQNLYGKSPMPITNTTLHNSFEEFFNFTLLLYGHYDAPSGFFAAGNIPQPDFIVEDAAAVEIRDPYLPLSTEQ